MEAVDRSVLSLQGSVSDFPKRPRKGQVSQQFEEVFKLDMREQTPKLVVPLLCDPTQPSKQS